jgi:hypothetical protein
MDPEIGFDTELRDPSSSVSRADLEIYSEDFGVASVSCSNDGTEGEEIL